MSRRPPLSQIPSYRARGRKQQAEPGSHPYRILVLTHGRALKARFTLINLMSMNYCQLVTIPLRGEDILKFDFGAPYHKTLAEALFAYEWVDYRQFPMNFDRYQRGDQVRIAARMLAVLEAAHEGIDLETGPFPIKEMTLETALAQIETLKQQET